MSTYKWSCFQGGREDQHLGIDLQGLRASRDKKAQNGDVGTFCIQTWKSTRKMNKLSLAPPLLPVMSDPVLKRIFCNTVSIASGSKISKGRGLSLPNSPESSKVKPRFQSRCWQRVENQSLELEDTKTMDSTYRYVIILSNVNTNILVQRCPNPFRLRSWALKIWGISILPIGTVKAKEKKSSLVIRNVFTFFLLFTAIL